MTQSRIYDTDAEKIQHARELARQRIAAHPDMEHPGALYGIAMYVASFCDITVAQAEVIVHEEAQ